MPNARALTLSFEVSGLPPVKTEGLSIVAPVIARPPASGHSSKPRAPPPGAAAGAR
ncbi:hypothetical protein ACTMTI_53800 [Nonomuraea sp. H19]|uniref:hypothetical protein n=1 Tax=Nonomuraea sp. H19 TaxID=3452206 RepID=UPI003F8C37FF